MEKKETIQTHCIVYKKPFRKNESVYTDTMFKQIQHAARFIYRDEFIKDKGTYEEIVNKFPRYKNEFIVK